jgi:hypothetical protein
MMLALTALPGPAVAKDVSTLFVQPPHAGGWYPGAGAAVFQFDVDPTPIAPADGTHQERITDIACSGAAYVDHRPLPSQLVTTVEVRTANASTGPAGATVSCQATYERSFAQCQILFGAPLCSGWGPWVPAGTESASATFKIDTTGPTNVVGQPSGTANTNGWYRIAGTVSWSGVDTLSGIYACDIDRPFGGIDTASGVAVGGCVNNAGLRTNAYFAYKFDATPPSLAPMVSPSTVRLNGSATASPNASDSLSGVDTAGCDPVDTNTVGTHSVSCTATDQAGNEASESVSYMVEYGFSGFAEPVQTDAVNVAKAGRAIPLKWRVTDADGNPVTNLENVSVTTAGVACDIGESADVVAEYATGKSGLQNLGDGYYQFNWSTPKSYARSCKVLHLDLGDGSDHTAEFRFEK